MITRYFNLNLTAGRSVPLVINVNQYDRNEQWLFTLYDSSNQKYTPSSGAIVGIKSDGLGIVNTGSVDSEGRVVINETEQMTAAVGKAVYELMIDGQTHGTANFIVLVEAKPGNNADLSESDLSLLQEAIDTTSPANIAAAVQTWMDENLDTSSVVDSTLTISGAAADAKVTGDRIGDLTDLVTEDQSSLVGAINETKTDLYNWFTEDIEKVKYIYEGSGSDADIYEVRRLEWDAANDADITGLKVITRKEGTSTDTSKFFVDGNELMEYVIGDTGDLSGTITEEISDLKSALTVQNVSGLTLATYTTGGYINTGAYSVGETVPLTVTAGTNRAYALFDCDPGEKLTITGKGGSNYITYSFLDENNVLLAKDSASQTRVDYVVIAPANTTKALLCANTEYAYSCIIGSSWKDAVNSELARIDSINDILKINAAFTTGYFLNKTTGNTVSDNNYGCTDYIDITGIVYPIRYTVKSFNNIAIACLYDENHDFLSSIATTGSTVTEITGVVETYGNARYIRFCSSIKNGYSPKLLIANVYDGEINVDIGMENVEFKRHNNVTNLIDKNACQLGYINGSTDGSIHSSSSFYVTGYIPVDENKEYYFNSYYIYRGYYAFYDADKEYISGGGSSSATFLTSPFTPPAGAKYGRFTTASVAALANAWLCETNQMAVKPADFAYEIVPTPTAEKPTDYTGDEISVFTKILCIGDSLTDGFFNESGGSRLIMRNRSYPAKLQALTGVECTNLGYAGYTSVQWYAEYANTDMSGHDAAIIQLGVNDALQSVSTEDTTTAFANIIAKVKADNPGIKIFVATITPANGYMLESMQTMSETIRTIVSNLNDANVYLVDLWAYGHTDDYLAYDAGHLSALGYLRLAKDYKAYISYIIHSNIDDFRYVQFIGTNYSYSGDAVTRAIHY